MSDRKTCIRCGRNIDRYARICPFCNWDQNEAVPPPRPAVAAPPDLAYRPPADRSWMKPVLGGVGGLLMVIIMFAVGMLIHRKGPPPATTSSKQAATAPAGPATPSTRANVTLVPDNGPVTSTDQPFTSAPAQQQAQGVPTEYQRTDATAASSNEYAQMAQRAEAERQAAILDPRTVRANPAARPAPRPEANPQQPASTPAAQPAPPAMTSGAPPAAQPNVVRTRPVAEYQPLPEIHVKQRMTAVLDLVIGPDGHVREVNVRTPIPGETGKLVEAVQKWRFKPATENGVPVQAPFTVDISFNADE